MPRAGRSSRRQQSDRRFSQGASIGHFARSIPGGNEEGFRAAGHAVFVSHIAQIIGSDHRRRRTVCHSRRGRRAGLPGTNCGGQFCDGNDGNCQPVRAGSGALQSAGPAVDPPRGPHSVGRPRFTTHVGAPGLSINGRVTVDGGKPCRRRRVVAGASWPLISATTDADGRYRIAGLPRGGETQLRFGLGGNNGLLPQTSTVSTTADDSQKTVDVELKRAIVLKGRVLDRSTGKGAPHAQFQLLPLTGNEFVEQPGNEGLRQMGTIGRADENANFEVVAFPGPAALVVNGPGDDLVIGGQHFTAFRLGYISPEDEPKLKFATLPGGERGFQTAGGVMPVMQTFTVKYVNLAADGSSPPVDVVLDRGQTAELEIVDTDGQPVTGAAIAGIGGANSFNAVRLPQSRTTIYALGGGPVRKIVVLHAARGLAGSISLTGVETSPVQLTLARTGSVRGRALDEFKAPISEAQYGIRAYSTDGLRRLENSGQPQPATDKDGRFQIANLVPGEPFTLSTRLDGISRSAKISKPQPAPEPGQDLDLGDVVFATQKPGKTIDLDLVDSEGQPVTGAAISGLEELNIPFRLRESRIAVFGLDKDSPRSVVVLHGPRGLDASLTLTGDEPSPMRLTLAKTASIGGRAVGKSSQPIAGAACSIFSTTVHQLFEFENAGRPAVITDKQGRFRIGNMIPGERFELRLRLGGELLAAKLSAQQQTLKPGQDIDLGDVVFAPLDPQRPEPNEPQKPGDKPKGPDGTANSPPDKNVVPKPAVAKTANSVLSTEYSVPSTQNAGPGTPSSPVKNKPETGPDSNHTLKFAGTVVDPDGKPVAGARICILGWYGGVLTGVKERTAPRLEKPC